ncbi:6138_t:CDS:2 [Dentiscutata erythropus]|uniref:6138_t:CDS:1 n=1 Tax=Dentiscutata erythropus TaxID=1348616 RepID=A0A9N9NT05_9GLOM|nr:6138_t:CDS:2 [Dentiscutata erythropus]
MTTITGQINLINNLLGIVDIKLKFIPVSVGNELRIVDTPPSGDKIRKIPFKQDASTTAIVSEIEIRVRPVLNDCNTKDDHTHKYKDSHTNSLEYRTYTAKFDKDISFYNDITLNLTIGDKDTHSDKVTLGVGNTTYTAVLVSIKKYILDMNQNQTKKNVGTEKNVGCPMANNLTFTHKTDNDSTIPQEVSNDSGENWLFRFIHGKDSKKVPLTSKDSEKLSDIFGEKLKKSHDVIPLTLRQLLNFLDDIAPKQKSFLVADGAHIKWSDDTSQINRQVRFVVIRQPARSWIQKLNFCKWHLGVKNLMPSTFTKEMGMNGGGLEVLGMRSIIQLAARPLRWPRQWLIDNEGT